MLSRFYACMHVLAIATAIYLHAGIFSYARLCISANCISYICLTKLIHCGTCMHTTDFQFWRQTGHCCTTNIYKLHVWSCVALQCCSQAMHVSMLFLSNACMQLILLLQPHFYESAKNLSYQIRHEKNLSFHHIRLYVFACRTSL